MDELRIIDNPATSRFEFSDAAFGGAHLEYRLQGRKLVLDHTRVPEEFGGRGVGSRLVKAAMDHAEREGLTVIARCPFARDWLERNYPADSFSRA